MILTKEDIDSLRQRLLSVRRRGSEHFAQAEPVRVVEEDHWGGELERVHLDIEVDRVAEELRATIKGLSVDIAGAARGSPLLEGADMQELRHCTRQMLAAVRLREYRHTGIYVHHDEGVVLGVDPPSHEELPVEDVASAQEMFESAGARVLDVVDLLAPTDSTQSASADSASYRPDTAFIMMAIDESRPELEDVRDAIRDVFSEFGIRAVTADEIEHEDAITDRILQEIDTSEFLIADLTLERPNVYYEVAHAHALNKRVVLFRKQGTRLHFDVAHRNCPEYRNAADLKRLLRRRLESVTNRPNPVRL